MLVTILALLAPTRALAQETVYDSGQGCKILASSTDIWFVGCNVHVAP